MDFKKMYKDLILECDYALSQLENLEENGIPKDTGLREEIQKHSGKAKITYYSNSRKEKPQVYTSYKYDGKSSHILSGGMGLPLQGDLTIETEDGFRYEGFPTTMTNVESILQAAKKLGTEKYKTMVLAAKKDFEKELQKLETPQAEPGAE